MGADSLDLSLAAGHEAADVQRGRGPAYSPTAWFGLTTGRDRTRYQRALRDLMRAGLVEPFKFWGEGGRITNVKLTEKGEHAARSLAGTPPVIASPPTAPPAAPTPLPRPQGGAGAVGPMQAESSTSSP